MTQVLLISPDRIAGEMAGAGMRYHELARVVATAHDVIVAAPVSSESSPESPPLVTYDPDRVAALRPHISAADVVVSPPLVPKLFGALAPRRWIVDLYNPEPFEGLEHQRGMSPLERKVRDVVRIDRITYAVRFGSAFVCASERQRDMWLGFLAATRRLNSNLYDTDRELRCLIDVVPPGVPRELPERGEAQLRGVVFADDARIMLWHGGLWDWLDPLTAIHALRLLRENDEHWVLAFTGTQRPSHREQMSMSRCAITLARKLAFDDGTVHFNPSWTPYALRATPLLEADVGLSLHQPTLESRFASRTRMVDYVWTRLPVVCTAGDEWAQRVRERNLGRVVVPSDAEALASAARDVAAAGRQAYDDAFAQVAVESTWERVAQPLLRLVGEVATGHRGRQPVRASIVGARHTIASTARRIVCR